MIHGCVFKGVQSVGKVVWLTVPLPILLLAVLLGRGAVTLPGFADGWRYYLQPEWSTLASPEVWTAAASQVFFTLTLGFGVLVAYASQKPEEADVSKDGFVTALINSGIALFAGFVVFGVVGYMAAKSASRTANTRPGLWPLDGQ